VTDAGLIAVSDMKQMNSLFLLRTQVSKLAAIRNLTELNDLWLAGSPVTDVGLRNLKGLAKLKELYIGDTEVTDAGVAELRIALPRLKIRR
jgi:Leucine-rich repeat (LRR) protein